MKTIRRKIFLALLVLIFSVVSVFDMAPVMAETAAQIQDKLDDLAKKQKEAEAELAAEQSKLNKNQAQIAATKSKLSLIISNIASKEKELRDLSDQAEFNKKLLAEYIRQIYYSSQENNPVIELTVFEGDLSRMVEGVDGMLSIKEKINDSLQIINDAKTKTELAKADLADQQADHKDILREQQVEQIAITEDIEETKDTLEEIQKKFSELQSDLNALLGTNYNAKDIKDAVSFASDKTGVSKGVLYGFLKQETNLGKNTGQCSYDDVEKVSIPGYKKYGKKYQASIDRLKYRRKLFEQIIDDLGYKSKKVSCTIPFSKAGPNQGGAMGVAQFMSDTWLAYGSRISSKTGHRNPDPWNITDGVMGLAIKVAAAGGTSDSPSAIKKATISYYGAFSQGYYNTVLYWSKNYKKLI